MTKNKSCAKITDILLKYWGQWSYVKITISTKSQKVQPSSSSCRRGRCFFGPLVKKYVKALLRPLFKTWLSVFDCKYILYFWGTLSTKDFNKKNIWLCTDLPTSIWKWLWEKYMFTKYWDCLPCHSYHYSWWFFVNNMESFQQH